MTGREHSAHAVPNPWRNAIRARACADRNGNALAEWARMHHTASFDAIEAPRQTPQWWERATWVGAITCWHALYHWIPTWIDGSRAHTLQTPIDRLVPFAPAWMFAYVAIYPAVLVPAVAIRSTALLRRVGVAQLVVQTAAFACFLLAPVTSVGLRPDAVEVDSFPTWAVALNYRIDAPLNCFPSLHVASTTLGAFALARVSRPLGLFGAALAAVIALSTMFVKQHYLADVVAGGLLAMVVARATIGDVHDASTHRERRVAQRVGVGVFALFYALVIGGAHVRYEAEAASRGSHSRFYGLEGSSLDVEPKGGASAAGNPRSRD
jgi:membrane-associated phospholipid phosphatase